jgi:hypothetical protein
MESGTEEEAATMDADEAEAEMAADVEAAVTKGCVTTVPLVPVMAKGDEKDDCLIPLQMTVNFFYTLFYI